MSNRYGIFSPVRYIRRAVVKRGVRSQSTFWRVVFALVLGEELLGRSPLRRGVRGDIPFWTWIVTFRRVLDLLKGLFAPSAEFVAVERLRPGEFVRIEATERER